MDDDPKKLSTRIQMLATLVATATYVAAFNPPGGVWQDIHNAAGHLPGDAIMRSTHHLRYAVFFYCNAVAFTLSLIVVVVTLFVTAYREDSKLRRIISWYQGLLMAAAMLAFSVAYGAGACRDKLTSLWYIGNVPLPFLHVLFEVCWLRRRSSMMRREGGSKAFLKLMAPLSMFALTISYVAGLSTPGGFWDSAEGGHRPGDAILRDRLHGRLLKLFLILNTMTFVASLYAVSFTLFSVRIRIFQGPLTLFYMLCGLLGAYIVGSSRGARSFSWLFYLLVSACIPLYVVAYVAVIKLLQVLKDKVSRLMQKSRTEGGAAGSEAKSDPAIVEDPTLDPVISEDEKATRQRRRRRAFLVQLMAGLAVAITYQAGLYPPGGLWPANADGHMAGDPILLTTKARRYKGFYYCNSVSFVASFLAIFLAQKPKEFLHEHHALEAVMILDMLGLIGAYAIGSCRDQVSTLYAVGIAAAAVVYVVIHVSYFTLGETDKKNTRAGVGAGAAGTEGRAGARAADPEAGAGAAGTEGRAEAGAADLEAGAGAAGTEGSRAGARAADPEAGAGAGAAGNEGSRAEAGAPDLEAGAGAAGTEGSAEAARAADPEAGAGAAGTEGRAEARAADPAARARATGTEGRAAARAAGIAARAGGDNLLQNQDNDRLEKLGGGFLLFAILVASITYQAGLTPPGGFLLKDDAQSGHHAGDPVLLYNYPRRYKAFFYCNSVSFMLSIVLILLLVNPNQYRPAIRSHALTVCSAVSYVCLMGAFAAGSTQHLTGSYFIFVMAGLPSLSSFILLIINWWKGDEARPSRSSSRYHDTLREPEEEKTSKIVYLVTLAILVASATYPAGLDPPGGSWQSSSDGHEAGNPVMHDSRRQRYLAFFVGNTTSFLASVMFILLLLVGMLPAALHTGIDGLVVWLSERNKLLNGGLGSLQCLGFLVAYAAGSSRQWKTSAHIGTLLSAVLLFVAIHVSLSFWRKPADEENQQGQGSDGGVQTAR